MHISRKTTPLLTQYSINENILEHVSIIKDLGVLITNNLFCSKHIESFVSKANKTLGLIKRICRDVKNINTRRILYCTLVRPKLEYASSVWSSYTIKHRMLLENVQRRATNQEYFQNAYFIWSTKLWNSLPTETKSLCSFKTRLSNLYSSRSKTYKLSNNYVAKN